MIEIVEEETDVVSDDEESQADSGVEVRQSADFGGFNKPQSRNKPVINSIRDTALNNFNRFKDLNQCLSVKNRLKLK